MAFLHCCRALLLGLIATWLTLTAATAQSLPAVPALTARVMDHTTTLSSKQTATIEARLRSIEEQFGAQVVVLMVASTAPEDIAPYAHRVASTWQIGRKDVGDGLLIVIAKNDRRMRIEVARALEGAIPDLAASRIIEQQMAPYFRQDDYASGILAAVNQISAHIAGEALAPPSRPVTSDSAWTEDLLFFLFAFVVSLGATLRNLLGHKLGALLMGGGVFVFVLWRMDNLVLAVIAGGVAFLFTLLGNSSRSGLRTGSGSRHGGGGRSGGFRSGGGGSFGGGGASGRW